ncbi:helix-turn-helix transcriptional regulator [Blastococcus mobilis]|uniref:Helix-turn-helix domain-containing protein n=1 Tax=Blastococcus mobilis TaxID=1938746 RepID=A0A238VQI5_9ACTN|nr:Helix-turn-helix domain-containing protein [Blastococcus mobilis]
MDQRLLTTQEVSARYGVPRRTLYYWRSIGQGPHAIKVGRHLRWPQDGLRDWESRLALEQIEGAK